MSSAILLYKMKSLFFSQWTKSFRKHKPVSFKFCINFSAIKHNSSILFLAQTLYTFVKSSLLKCKFFGLSARVKICQIPCGNFEQTSQFLFKFCIILHCHDKYFPCKFWAHIFSTLDKRIPSKFQFLDFQRCSGENLLNSSCHFWEHKSLFFQILHRFSVPSSKTPLYFF